MKKRNSVARHASQPRRTPFGKSNRDTSSIPEMTKRWEAVAAMHIALFETYPVRLIFFTHVPVVAEFSGVVAGMWFGPDGPNQMILKGEHLILLANAGVIKPPECLVITCSGYEEAWFLKRKFEPPMNS